MPVLAHPHALPLIKAALAATATVLVVLEARVRHPIATGVKAAVGATLVAGSLLAFFQFLELPPEGYFHHWDVYHYYLGAKYAPELGYERLYTCTAVAEAELGHADEVARRALRDLRDDGIITAAEVLEEPRACTKHFSASRWAAFRADVAWFRSTSSSRARWEAMQLDHGYNPSPVWTAAGRAIASVVPVERVALLPYIDLVVLAGAFLSLVWGFGWRVAAIGAIFFGTQAPAEAAWTAGAFLRHDWLFLAALAAAAMRRHRFGLAGVALIWAGLLRVFPLLLWAGPLIVIGGSLWRNRSLRLEHHRLLWGGLLGAALLVPAGAVAAGPAAYREFAVHIGMHARTPISNHMSLRTLFSSSTNNRLATTRPGPPGAPDPWIDGRRACLQRRWTHYVSAAALFTGVFVLAVSRLRTTWLALGLSLALVIAWTDPSSYYYSAWLLVAPLGLARRSIEPALLATAACSQLLAVPRPHVDDRFVALAALYVAATAAMLLLFARRPRLRFLRTT